MQGQDASLIAVSEVETAAGQSRVVDRQVQVVENAVGRAPSIGVASVDGLQPVRRGRQAARGVAIDRAWLIEIVPCQARILVFDEGAPATLRGRCLER